VLKRAHPVKINRHGSARNAACQIGILQKLSCSKYNNNWWKQVVTRPRNIANTIAARSSPNVWMALAAEGMAQVGALPCWCLIAGTEASTHS